MGHCGKKNIRVSWIFVKLTLILNYMGQGAWILNNIPQTGEKTNPFYEIMPDWFLLPGIAIATMATIIASQAMISGSFTLVAEALRLNVWPKVKLKYPSDLKGQIYVPSVNLLLWIGCIAIVLYFKESTNEDGFVDKVYSNLGNDEQRYVKVRIRKDKKPELGDKFCSRYGQKGTIGMLMDPYNMPFSRSGIQPDMIVNAHAFPSRMTIAQFLELIMGKACVERGLFSEVAAFSEVNVENLSDALLKLGFEGHGNEALYCGITGEIMHVNYFIGPTYYQRLTHQVSDKYQSRDDGLKTALTHQPVGGRALGGGGRIGEMERDGLLSHGVASYLKEAFMERSDKTNIYISNKTGQVAACNVEKNIYNDFSTDEIIQDVDENGDTYRIARGKTDSEIVNVELPYAMKLMLQEVESMGISPRLVPQSVLKTWTPDNEKEIQKQQGNQKGGKKEKTYEVDLSAFESYISIPERTYNWRSIEMCSLTNI
jgi:hypothetical protein